MRKTTNYKTNNNETKIKKNSRIYKNRGKNKKIRKRYLGE